MKTTIAVLYLTACTAALLPPGGAHAQNLVSNGSFEDYTLCPTTLYQIDRATGWMSAWGSPDYFNSCAPDSSYASVPMNGLGYQEAFDGNAYAGILTYTAEGVSPVPNTAREVLSVALISPLVPGIPVYLSFRTAVGGDGTILGASARLASEGIGIRFSTVPTFQYPIFNWPNSSALRLDYVPMDTASWVLVGGMYVPDSAYTYAMIGNFYDNPFLAVDTIFPDSEINFAYTYIDGICVSTNPQQCGYTAIGELNRPTRLVAYPDPFADELTILFNGPLVENSEIALIDALGVVRFRSMCGMGERTKSIKLGGLVSGTYSLTLTSTLYGMSSVRLVHVSP